MVINWGKAFVAMKKVLLVTIDGPHENLKFIPDKLITYFGDPRHIGRH